MPPCYGKTELYQPSRIWPGGLYAIFASIERTFWVIHTLSTFCETRNVSTSVQLHYVGTIQVYVIVTSVRFRVLRPFGRVTCLTYWVDWSEMIQEGFQWCLWTGLKWLFVCECSFYWQLLCPKVLEVMTPLFRYHESLCKLSYLYSFVCLLNGLESLGK